MITANQSRDRIAVVLKLLQSEHFIAVHDFRNLYTAVSFASRSYSRIIVLFLPDMLQLAATATTWKNN